MTDKIYPIAVIGGGSAGTMAVMRCILNNDETIFFPGTPLDKKRSRALWVYKVENMPGHLSYKKGIEEPNRENLEWLSQSDFSSKFHWMKNRGVSEVTKESEFFLLKDNKGDEYKARFVIIATGVMDTQPLINNKIKDIFPFANAQSVDYCLRCDGHHVLGKELAVIGHKSDAVWVGAILKERYDCPNVTILTHGQKPQFDQKAKELIELYKFDVEEEEIEQVLGDEKTGKLDGFILCCGTSVYSQIAFVALGMIIYNELAVSLGAKTDERGFVIGQKDGLTNIDGLYVCGDLKANTKKQIYTAWDNAVDSADSVNRILRTEKRQRLLEAR